ncbi:uncharacterized protein LOC134273504 [Saccostrea cucullata]|uniref:uncharacterized protein LOC134273504 n=1 Tax=Saccostrea cuccullata TaxID=36930 RepID=UPI002ED3D0A8
MDLYFKFSFVVVFQVASKKGPCDNRIHGCCSETIWNETLQKCTGCGPGFIGEFCNVTCEYPDYGMGCQMMCHPNQSKSDYDFRTGCSTYDDPTIGQTTKANLVRKETTPLGVIFNPKNMNFSANNTTPLQRSFPGLKISIYVLLAVFLVTLFFYFIIRKCVNTNEQEEEHFREENNHYEDVQDIKINSSM